MGDEHYFINPYNFVPLGNQIDQNRISRENAYDKSNELVSGWISVGLDTKTPIIIPDGAHPDYLDTKTKKKILKPTEAQKKEAHKSYNFMRIPKVEKSEELECVIPGSELRGMIRNIYETITDSCFPFLLDAKPISQRILTYGSLNRRGLLGYVKKNGKGHWVLYNTYADKKVVNVQRTRMDPAGSEYVEENQKKYLQYNIPVNPRNYHIAYLTKKDIEKEWDEGDDTPYRELKSALNRDGAIGAGNNPNEYPNKSILKALENAKKGNGNLVPVYYFPVTRGKEKLIYLSNSSIGRIAQRRKWEDIMAEYSPCNSTDNLCPACLMFGIVKGNGMKGHVRFSDARPVSRISVNKHSLQILSTPRTSSFEFYLRRPDGKNITYWNFDYVGKKEKRSDGKDHTEYYDLEKATPRGRKRYWHSKLAPDVAESDNNNMNSTMEAATGSFEFKVFFDNITEEQLQDLIWSITLGENKADSKYQHKIGHAKPLGYGSVKLVVKEKVLRRVYVEDGKLKVALDAEPVGTEVKQTLKDNEDILKALLTMCDATTVEKYDDAEVMYPWNGVYKRGVYQEDKNETIFNWFSSNRMNAKYLKTLPEPTDKDIRMVGKWKKGPYYTPEKDDIGESNKVVGYTPQKGDMIECKITKLLSNNQAFVEYSGGRGKIFEVNRSVDKNDTVEVLINNVFDNGDIRGNFKKIVKK